MRREHQRNVVPRSQRGQRPHMLAVYDVGLEAAHFLVQGLLEFRQIALHLLGAQVLERHHAHRMRGEAGEVERQGAGVGRRGVVGVREEHGMQPHALVLGDVHRVLGKDDAHLMPELRQLRGKVLRVRATPRTLKREMVNHEDFHVRSPLSNESNSYSWPLIVTEKEKTEKSSG